MNIILDERNDSWVIFLFCSTGAIPTLLIHMQYFEKQNKNKQKPILYVNDLIL